MPVNDRYPLATVLAACRAHYERKRRRVFVEYVMLAGVNDTYGQAVQLAELLDPKVFKVNLIPYNPTDALRGSSREAIAAFKAVLEEHGMRATVRLTRGRDIDAACGQLAAARARSSGIAPPPRRRWRGAGARGSRGRVTRVLMRWPLRVPVSRPFADRTRVPCVTPKKCSLTGDRCPPPGSP